MRLQMAALVLLLCTVGCGDSTPAPTPIAVPTVTFTGVGEGALVVHPSADPRFQFALECPVRVRETSGGSASWSFVRMSLLRNGLEIERSEIGQTTIAAAGFGAITANSNQLVRMIFRFNSQTFTQVNITLGVNDNKDGRALTTDVPFGSFSGVNTSLAPLTVPFSRVERY